MLFIIRMDIFLMPGNVTMINSMRDVWEFHFLHLPAAHYILMNVLPGLSCFSDVTALILKTAGPP